MAVAMQYGRTSSLGLKYMNGVPAKEPLGTVLRGSYNTFLNQDCWLLLVNPTSSTVSANISMVRYDGNVTLAGEQVSVPDGGLLNYDLCSHDQTNVYGVVTVQTAAANSLAATLLRIGSNSDYRFPAPVRH